MTPASGTRLAAGLYYNYLKSDQNMQFMDTFDPSEWYIDNYTNMPKTSEHRLTLRLLAEQELNSVLSLRGGLSAFYGLAKRDYSYYAMSDSDMYWPVDVSADGAHYGVNASLGASIKAGAVVLEPFINAGYAKLKTDGDGVTWFVPTYVEANKTNWLAGGGLSVKF